MIEGLAFRFDSVCVGPHRREGPELKFILANLSGVFTQPESWDTWSDIRLPPNGATGFVLS